MHFPQDVKSFLEEEGGLLSPGQIIHAVISEERTNEPPRLLAASIGVGIFAEKI